MRSLASLLCAVAAVLGVVFADPATAAVTEYPVPTPNSHPGVMATGPDGTVWFSEDSTGKIGHVDSAGAISEMQLWPASGGAAGMAFGSDGALWLSHGNDAITRLTTSGVQTDFPSPTANSSPLGVVAGSDGAVWYTEYRASAIARIDPSGPSVTTEYPTPTPDAHPRDMVSGPDGALWFTESSANLIGRLDPSTRAITEYPAGGQPFSIASRTDGLWMTYSDSNALRRMSTTGTLSTPYIAPNSALFVAPKIAVGPDNNLWFTEFYGGQVGQFDPATSIFGETQPPTAGTRPYGIAATAQGIWFSEENANQVAFIPVAGGPGYVALGDSFSSGEGSPPYQPDSDDPATFDTCHRSDRAYGPLLSQDPALGTFVFKACSGAVTDDFASNNTSNPNEGPQLNWLTPTTTTATLTIGGNDAGFVNIINHCVSGIRSDAGWLYKQGYGCSSSKPLKRDTANRLAALAGNGSGSTLLVGRPIHSLRSVIQGVHDAAGAAHIVVGGYPHLFGGSATTYETDRKAPSRLVCSVGSAFIALKYKVDYFDAVWLNGCRTS